MDEGSIEIRSATDDDVAAIVALVADRVGTDDAQEARLVLDDPSFDRSRWTVAVEGGLVVSTMASFALELRIGTVALAGSMIEFVTTDVAYEHRGLVRRQFAVHHAMAAERDELVQFIVGIPYFYRRLGYEYAVPVPGYHTIRTEPTARVPEGFEVRDAIPRDVPAIQALQRATAERVDLEVRVPDRLWRWYLESPVYDVRLAEHDEVVKAAWRSYRTQEERIILDLAATSAAGVEPALSDGDSDDGPLRVLTRPGLSDWLDRYGEHEESRDAFFVRVGDPAALLDALRPELERRLAASQLGSESGEALISFYTSSIRFAYENGWIGAFVPGPPIQAPVSAGGSGVPPDLVAALMVGPQTVEQLDALHPMCCPAHSDH